MSGISLGEPSTLTPRNGATVDTVDDDLRLYFAEVGRADLAIDAMPSLDSVGPGHGRPLAATLVKMIRLGNRETVNTSATMTDPQQPTRRGEPP